MKVLLIPLHHRAEVEKPVFPLGIGYLLSSLKKVGIEAQSMPYHNAPETIIFLRSYLSNYNPDVVGLTCTTFNRSFVKAAISVVKSYSSDIKIVVGGVHASCFPFQMIDHYKADVVVIGEGGHNISRVAPENGEWR